MARWDPLYENLEAAQCGDLLTYEAAQELGFDLQGGDRWMVGAVRERLWHIGRDLVSEPGVGYRLACGDESVDSGKRRGRRGARVLRQAATLTSAAAAVGGLTRYEAQKVEDHAQFMRRLADRVSRRRL